MSSACAAKNADAAAEPHQAAAVAPPLQETDASLTTGSSTTYEDEEASAVWEERFAELVHFQRGHGHCRVPHSNGALGKWVSHLRSKYKRFLHEQRYRGQLTQERIARLNELQFEWTIKPPATPWDNRFAELKDFYETHGHTRVRRKRSSSSASKSKDHNNNRDRYHILGEWVNKQRRDWRAGKLSAERIGQLQSIHFEQRLVRSANKTWDESFESLLDFRRQHGHVNVPKPWKKTPQHQQGNDDDEKQQEKHEDDDEYHSLRFWAERMRLYYHSYFLKNKPHSTLTTKRVRKLNDVGFDWGAHRSNSQTWSRHFCELKAYMEEHDGDSHVPVLYPPNKALGRWAADQRANYRKWRKGKKTPLTTERRLALEKIGFAWHKQSRTAKTTTTKTNRATAARKKQDAPVLPNVKVAPSSSASVEGTASAKGGDSNLDAPQAVSTSALTMASNKDCAITDATVTGTAASVATATETTRRNTSSCSPTTEGIAGALV